MKLVLKILNDKFGTKFKDYFGSNLFRGNQCEIKRKLFENMWLRKIIMNLTWKYKIFETLNQICLQETNVKLKGNYLKTCD